MGATGDVYVTYTISIASDDGATPIPAFQFRLPTSDEKLAKEVQANNPNWYYWFNTAALKQSEGKENGDHGPYKTADYTPATGYVGVGGSDNNGITEKTTVMTIVAKFEKGSVSSDTTHTLKPTEFIAGGTKNDGGVNAANAFGTCTVNGDTVTVKAGVTVSGTVKDSSGEAVSGAAVELYQGGKAVATGVTTDSSGKYTFSDVSTGTYTVKAKSSDGSLNGSAPVTVVADSISNVDVTLQKWQKGDVNKDGVVSIADVQRLYTHLNKTNLLTDTSTADVNGDGVISIADIQRLYTHLNKTNPLT